MLHRLNLLLIPLQDSFKIIGNLTKAEDVSFCKIDVKWRDKTWSLWKYATIYIYNQCSHLFSINTQLWFQFMIMQNLCCGSLRFKSTHFLWEFSTKATNVSGLWNKIRKTEIGALIFRDIMKYRCRKNNFGVD